MIFTTLETAQRIEEADNLHLTRQVELCTSIFADETIQAQAVGGGVGAVTLTEFGRKLNHIVGFGMNGKVSREDLIEIETLYSSKYVAAEVDMCPHSDATALQALASGGYTVNGFVNVYARAITDSDLQETDHAYGDITISRITSERAEGFLRCSVAGFAVTGRPRILLETLARIAALRADTQLYLATIGGQIAGTAGLALIETSKGGVAHLYIDSAMLEYRGRGIQAALLQARLSDARRAGFDFAVLQARPSNASARNAERAGFSLAYTKPTFSKQFK